MRSVVEVAVLVVGLTFAAGIMAPLVNKVREVAARTQCANNFKQFGLTLENYRSCNEEQFPPAGRPNDNLPLEKRLSWIVNLGPYIQSDNLYERMDTKKGWDAEENRYLAVRRMRLVECYAFPEGEPESTLVPSHYVGIAGLGPDAASLPAKDARAGFFGYERKLHPKDLGERGSAILVAIETAQASGAWTVAGFPTLRDVEEGSDRYLGSWAPFGGTHRGGAQALFADASVRFLDNGLDSRVLEEMATVKER
jgi:hypothetical protein